LDAAKTLHAYEIIENSIKSQAALIDDLIDVSRIVNSKFQLQTQEVDVEAIIKSVMEALQPAVEEKQIQIILVPICSVPRVTADSVRLQQVVWNLLSNAIKFTSPQRSVWFSLKCNDSYLEICITDTGDGIEREFLPFIFEPFRQGANTTRDRKAGLGLGLAIVREIVDLHHGSIKAYSEGAGKGSTFTVRLPLSTDQRISPKHVQIAV
jgi:signal transduction histidine kinase